MPHVPTAPQGATSQLRGVNERLAEMIETLRRGREQMLQARTPAGALGAGGPGVPAVALPVDRVPAEERLRARVAELEAAQQRTADELVEVEQQLTHFAVLFAALRQLHEAGSRGEALDAIQEIVVNLIGSEELAVLEAAPEGGALRPVRTMGVEPGRFAALRLGAGPLGEAILAGTALAAPDPRLVPLGAPPPTALVPLRGGGAVIGAIVVLGLLGHKEGLTSRDLEVLDLLQTHAAAALRATATDAAAVHAA